jgi:hypothetical protein
VYGNAPLIIPAILSNGAIFAVGVLMCMCVYVETMRLPCVYYTFIQKEEIMCFGKRVKKISCFT